jgi:hypothetical protein|tara:strand:- start:339 stop:1814 length:1476 start_codon:yes stop_codon:yes gene_type:complete
MKEHGYPLVQRRDMGTAARIFLTTYLVCAFFFKPDLSFARFVFVTKAIAHYGTVFVNQVENELRLEAADVRTYGEHRYVCCANLGLPFIALISYVPYATLVLPSIQDRGLDPVLELKLSQFVMALSTVVLFTASTAAIFYLCLRLLAVNRTKSILFTSLLYVGTPIAFYSLNVTNGQNIVGMFLLLCAFYFLLLALTKRIGAHWLISGLLAGLAVVVDLPAFAAWPFFLMHLVRINSRACLLWSVGALLGTLPFFLINAFAFGSFLPPHSQFLGMPLQAWLAVWPIFIEFTIGFQVGLLFYCPLLIVLLLAPYSRGLDVFPPRKIILIATLAWLFVISVATQLGFGGSAISGSKWYLNQGGGGPRYLLPVIPFLFVSLAQLRLSSVWLRRLFSWLCLSSIAINLPGLFWTGGKAWFLNNLMLFLKNGVNSYMLQDIRALLAYMGLNVAHFSIFPTLGMLTFVLWWLWKGDDLFRNIVGTGERAPPDQKVLS